MIKPEKVEDIIINAPCGSIPPPPPPTVKWGKIKGNINNQKDLINLLNEKLDDSIIQNTKSTRGGDIYDVTYINTMIGDIETLLSEV